MMMNRLFAAALGLALSGIASQAAELKYENDFEQAEVGSVPEEFLVINGDFAVKEEDGNKFLELPRAPLDSFNVMFGPSAKENIGVGARVFSTRRGRRYPTFGVALNGLGGYRLRVSPGKRQVEIYRGDDIQTGVPFRWQSGKWTHLKLELTREGENFIVEGKVWHEGEPEPEKPTIRFVDTEAPPSGRQLISGAPYATTPIRYDDLKVWDIKPQG